MESGDTSVDAGRGRESPKRPLRVALVGCGRIGSFTRPELRRSLSPGWLPLNHAEAIGSTPGLQLDSICDINAEHLERARLTLNVPAYSDYYRQIAETKPDIVSIATRTNIRSKIIDWSLTHGVRGIHCEKPISNNMGDCKKIISAIAERDTKLTYGTTRRFMDIFRLAHAMVRSGEIGKLVDVEVQLGRTLLLWNHPHSVDLFLYFAGDVNVSRVQGRCTFREAPQNDLFIDDDPIVEEASVEFDTGVTGHLSSKSGINVILTGTSGVLRVGDDGRWLEIKKGNAFAKRVETNVSMSGTVRAFSELGTAVRHGNAISIQPHEIEVGMAILLSIAKSALRDGDPVSPNMIEDNFSITGRFGDNYA